MASVGSSDSSSNTTKRNDGTEALRKSSETAKKTEGDLVKKQAKELRRINEAHYAELERLKENHNNQLEDLRKNSRDTISERDHRNQKDIQDVRDVYLKQLQEQAEESNRRDETLRKAGNNDETRRAAAVETRVQRLTDDYTRELNSKDEKFGEILDENRETQTQAVGKVRDKMEAKLDSNVQIVKAERDSKVSGLQKGFDEYRASAEAKIKDQEIRSFQDQRKGSDELMHAVTKERLSAQDTQEAMRDGFKEGLAQTRDRFAAKAAQQAELGQGLRDQLKSDVMDRMDNQVTRLERENDILKDVDSRKDMKVKNRFKVQMNNLTDAYQKNIDAYKGERDEVVRTSNDSAHRDVEHVRSELEQRLEDNNRTAMSRQQELNKIHTQAFTGLKQDNDIRRKGAQDMADERVKHVYEASAEDNARLIELQGQTHAASQHSHQEDLRSLRAAMDSDKQIAVGTLEERILKQENQHTERMNQVVSKYEKQVQGLKDDLTREKKQNDENMKRVVDEMTRMNKTAVDQVDAKSRERMRLVNQHHSQELQNLTKRNDEKMDQVLSEIKRT